MSTDIEPIYHLKDAAERCGVTVEVVRRWIAAGLRAMPIAKRRGAIGARVHDYIIRESWIIAFIDAKARIKVQPKQCVEKPAGKPARRGLVKADGNSPLGPCPV